MTGECITWFDVHWDGVAAGGFEEHIASTWDGPEFEERADPKDLTRLIPTPRAGEPGDLDEFGWMGICGVVHKFTNSSVQIGAEIPSAPARSPRRRAALFGGSCTCTPSGAGTARCPVHQGSPPVMVIA